MNLLRTDSNIKEITNFVSERKSFLVNRIKNIISVKFSNHVNFQELYKNSITKRSMAETKSKTAEALGMFYKICTNTKKNFSQNKQNENKSICTNEMLKSHYVPKDITTPKDNIKIDFTSQPSGLHSSDKIIKTPELASRNKSFNKLGYYKSLRTKSFEDLTQEIVKVTGKSIKPTNVKIQPSKTYEKELLTIQSWRIKESAELRNKLASVQTVERPAKSFLSKTQKSFISSNDMKILVKRNKLIYKNMRLRKNVRLGEHTPELRSSSNLNQGNRTSYQSFIIKKNV
jgi:hypothetical protein